MGESDRLGGLGQDAADILSAIIKGPGAWCGTDRIAERSGLDADVISECVDRLEGSKWLVAFSLDGPEVFYTFTPRAAEALGVEIRQVRGVDWWTARDKPARKPRRTARSAGGDGTDRLTDRGKSPEQAAIEAEEAELNWKPRGPFDPDKLPRPTVLVSRGGVPFRHASSPARCRNHGPRALRPNEFCLGCSAWGLDFVTRNHERSAATIAAA